MAEYDKPPPSYDEAIKQEYGQVGTLAPRPPQRPPAHTPSQPPMPQRPSSYTPPVPSRPSLSSTNPPQDLLNDLYTANEHLPFRYPKGYFCQKCKNCGYKVKYTKYCSTCWNKFYLNDHAYNPNPRLPFRYPKRYYCEKCNNTGAKIKNGKTCKDCYERFAPRNTSNVRQSHDVFGDLFGSTTTTTTYINGAPGGMGMGMGNGPMGMGNGPMGMPPPGTYYMPQQVYQQPPMRVRPGDPRIGGVLCGRCRGSGVVHFFLDEDLCPVCSGLGRILNQ